MRPESAVYERHVTVSPGATVTRTFPNCGIGVPGPLGPRLTERRSDGGGELESVAGGFGGLEDEHRVWSPAVSP
jgi:hypothetical protein